MGINLAATTSCGHRRMALQQTISQFAETFGLLETPIHRGRDMSPIRQIVRIDPTPLDADSRAPTFPHVDLPAVHAHTGRRDAGKLAVSARDGGGVA
jgi:hypothetical protein